MTRIASALVAASLLAVPCVVSAQNLGEAAAKEKERREKSKAPAKSYTEEDLRSGKLGGTVSNAGADASTSASDTKTPSSDASPAADAPQLSDEEKAAKAAEWHGRRDRIQGHIDRIKASIASFEARLADNTVPMYGPGRQAVVENLDRAKADLVKAQADLADAETEGRTNGY